MPLPIESAQSRLRSTAFFIGAKSFAAKQNSRTARSESFGLSAVRPDFTRGQARPPGSEFPWVGLRSVQGSIAMAAAAAGVDHAAHDETGGNHAGSENNLEDVYGNGFQPVRPACRNRLELFNGKLAIRNVVVGRKCHPVSPVLMLRDHPATAARCRMHPLVAVTDVTWSRQVVLLSLRPDVRSSI